MTRTSVFMDDGDQAVILPIGFEFEGSEVSIRREGDSIVLQPIADSEASNPDYKDARPDLGPTS